MQPSFDSHQFTRRAKAIDGHATADGGFETTGIAYSDYGRMRVIRKSPKQVHHRTGVPAWANSDESLRKRVLDMLERRLYLDRASSDGLSDMQRLARIDTISKAGIPALKAHLVTFVKRYSETPTPRLAIQIQNCDSDIMVRQRGVATIMISAVYKSYRLGMNSVQVGAELGIKPPSIRLWLWRLNRCDSKNNWWSRRWSKKKVTVKICRKAEPVMTVKVRTVKVRLRPVRHWTATEINTVVTEFRNGTPTKEIAYTLGRSYSSVHFAIQKYVHHSR